MLWRRCRSTGDRWHQVRQHHGTGRRGWGGISGRGCAPSGQTQKNPSILLSQRGVPGPVQWGPVAGLLGNGGHIQSGETEQSFMKGACVHCGQNSGKPKRGSILSCSSETWPVLGQGGRESGQQNQRGSSCPQKLWL